MSDNLPTANKSGNGWARGIGTFILVIIVSWIVREAVSLALTGTPTPTATQYTGYVISRDNYNRECSDAAIKENATTTDTISPEKLTAYCACTYDAGVAQWGGELFTSKLKDMAKTNVVTAEFNTIVNNCVAKENV